MSESKFTQGVWFIEKDANCNKSCWAISVKRDYDDLFHHCFAEVIYKMEHEHSNPELEANAYLIASAPDMYAEIERDIAEIEARLKFADKRTLPFNPAVKNLERKKALLSKARGESE